MKENSLESLRKQLRNRRIVQKLEQRLPVFDQSTAIKIANPQKNKFILDLKPLPQQPRFQLGLFSSLQEFKKLGYRSVLLLEWLRMLSVLILLCLMMGGFQLYCYTRGTNLIVFGQLLFQYTFLNLKRNLTATDSVFFILLFTPCIMAGIPIFVVLLAYSHRLYKECDQSISAKSLVFKQNIPQLSDQLMSQVCGLQMLFGYRILVKMRKIHQQHKECQRSLDYKSIQELQRRYEILKGQLNYQIDTYDPFLFAIQAKDHTACQALRLHYHSQRMTDNIHHRLYRSILSLFKPNQKLKAPILITRTPMPEQIIYQNLDSSFSLVRLMVYPITLFIIIASFVIANSHYVIQSAPAACKPNQIKSNSTIFCYCLNRGFQGLTNSACSAELQSLIPANYGGFFTGLSNGFLNILYMILIPYIIQLSGYWFRYQFCEETVFLCLTVTFFNLILIPFLSNIQAWSIGSQFAQLLSVVINSSTIGTRSMGFTWMKLNGYFFLGQNISLLIFSLGLFLKNCIKKDSNLFIHQQAVACLLCCLTIVLTPLISIIGVFNFIGIIFIYLGSKAVLASKQKVWTVGQDIYIYIAGCISISITIAFIYYLYIIDRSFGLIEWMFIKFKVSQPLAQVPLYFLIVLLSLCSTAVYWTFSTSAVQVSKEEEVQEPTLMQKNYKHSNNLEYAQLFQIFNINFNN